MILFNIDEKYFKQISKGIRNEQNAWATCPIKPLDRPSKAIKKDYVKLGKLAARLGIDVEW